ncbi:MAG: serine/threonine-protein kinase [Aureliella sp.]
MIEGGPKRSSHDCSQERIQQFLDESISVAQEKLLVEHLDSCETCRREMESTAAVETTWRMARDFLSEDVYDKEKPNSTRAVPEADGDASDHDSFTAEITSVLGVLAPTDDPEMLGRLGPYEVSGVVGAGGMGVVLKGHDLALDRVVAIKVLAPHLATSGTARKRFAREAKAAAAVLHPNVMLIHGVDNAGPLPYLVMPYMRGASLQKRIEEQGPLSLVEILRVAAQIASGLAAAHDQGLVHRDIKPANIMLADGLEQVAITDFGLARAVDDATMTRSGVITGTPQYMSPEQARGESIDARSDLFSLGSLIYAMCVGHSPFRAETSYGVLKRVNDGQPRDIRQINPEIPSWLSRFIELLHHKDPELRIGTARDVEAIVRRCLAHVEQPDSCDLPEVLREKPEARSKSEFARIRPSLSRLFVASCAGGLLVSAAAVFYFAWPSNITGRTHNAPSVGSGGTNEIETAASLGDTQKSSPTISSVETLEDLWNEMDDDFRQLEESMDSIQVIEEILNSQLTSTRDSHE